MWPSPRCVVHFEPWRPKEISQRSQGPVPTLFVLPQALTMPPILCWWTFLSFLPWGRGKRTPMEVPTHSEEKLAHGSDIILPALPPPLLTP